MISNKSKSKSNAKNTKYSVKSNITTRSQRNATNLSSSTTPNTSAALTDDTNIPNDNTTNTSKTKTKPKQTLKQKQSAASSSKHNVSTISFSTPHNASSSKKTVKTVNSTNKKIDFEELTARIETVEAQNQTLLDQIESLKCSIATLNTTTSPSCNSCKEQFNTLTSRIHDVETENKILRDQITNLNDAIVSVKTNIPEISAAAKPKPTPTSFSANTYHVPFKRISIFSDSMGRDLATNLRKFIDPKSITIYASVKPGAVFSDVIQPISNTCSDYTKDDVIFIMAGTNDMPGTSPASAKLLPSACLNQIAAKTNVIINSIPYRHDAHASLYARIQETNIGICAKTRHHKYTYFNSNLFLKRRHFTSHGLHFSKMGKLKFAEKFAMFLSQLSPGCSNLDVSHDVDLIDLTSADDDLLSKPIQRSDSLCQNTPSREVAGHKNMDNVTSNQSLIDSNFALDQSYSYDLTHLNLLSNVPSSASIPSFNLAPCSPLEIIKIVNGLQNKTSCGEDDIPMTVIKKVIHPISGPLSFIFNSSFSTSTFPTLFKNAVITPIHKGKGVMTDLNNFRPISVLNNFSKILEKLVAYRISTYLEHHNLLVEQQFGFRHGRSTSDAVAHFLQKLDRILASGQHAIAILCDLTKAFDCVDHALLLSKLPSFGIRGPTLHWIESYLSNRHQKVKVPNPSPPPVISTSTSSNSPPSNPSFLLPTSPHSPPTSLYPKPSSAHNQFSSNLSSLSHSVSPTSHSMSPSSLPNTSPPPPPLPCLSSRTGSIYTSPYNINHAQPTSTFSNSYHSNPLPPPSSLPSPHNLPLPPSHINSTTSLPPTSSGSSLTLTQRLHNRSVTPFSSPPTSSFTYSSSLQVLAGVPQGSVLGPLLFLLYMNDITSADQSAHITLFADDTTILVSGSNRADVLSKSAEVMSNIQSWFRANKLSLNQAKTSYIYFNSPQSSSLPPIETPNLSLSSATEVKFLGLVVDSKLKWKTHIENLIPKLSTACFAVGSVRRNVDSNAALLSYFSYFHSVMSYGIVYWGFSSEIKNIFLLQKRAVRAVFGLARHISCKPIFKERQILTVYAQVILDTCILVHRVAPTLSRQSEVHDHNTRNKNKLLLSSNKIMDRSFLREGIQLYNSLSDQYYAECHALIYVVDSNDRDRISESKETFDKMISNENLIGVPLLVLANKQDIRDCMGVREVKPIFNKNSAHLIGRRDCMVMPVSALTGEGIDEGIRWLVECIKRNCDVRPPRNLEDT
ncbi:hypothetical protein M8J77_022256 [Diaphorina citri]|nr:hypothetical protein M8J77_022256 [Diaphorina citri]